MTINNSNLNRESGPEAPSDFIRDIVAADVSAGRHQGIVTRFPPEPNGYLHIGHAKAICLNFGIARQFDGRCNLRMDDTNPTKEDVEYVDAIRRDVDWLLAGWADHCLSLKARSAKPVLSDGDGAPDFVQAPGTESPREPFYASDYFDALYRYAVELIRRGKAYVCDLSPEDTDRYRGAPDRPGVESPFRNRGIEESLDLFERMKNGEFPNGTRTLRAKIDMASPNLWMRDPVLYRIRHQTHHQTGDAWCIYPMYDFAHCLSDYIEGITHSICTLEFEVHRPLYDWVLENLGLPRALPHQYEFARLNLSYTLMSKRKLLQLVQEKKVSGWDDPRMPTLSGMRRRGIPAESIRSFCGRIGVTKYDGLTDVALLEHAIREQLNRESQRRMAVLRPVKVVLTNLTEHHREELAATNNPEDPDAGTRAIPFGRELYIDQDDFMETPPPKYFRLRPGGEVRLKYAYIIRCEEVVKDEAGEIVELRCTVDLDSKRGGPTAGRKVKGTIHWVSATEAIAAKVRLYDRLFTVPEPDGDDGDFHQFLNEKSLEVVEARLESSLRTVKPGDRYQFERLGYFCADVDSSDDNRVFNRTVTLRDSWAKKGKQR